MTSKEFLSYFFHFPSSTRNLRSRLNRESSTSPLPSSCSSSIFSLITMTSTSSNRSFLKYASLFILVFQNSALVLIMKLSRSTQVAANAPAYTTSTAVVMSELIKLLVSVYFLVSSSSSNINSTSYLPVSNNSTTTSKQPTSRLSAIFNDLFGPKSEYKKVLVPALLYYIQNNLQYIAVSLLDAATFQVTYQLKILTTALFSVGMLGKRPSVLEWVALFILTAGVAMVQLPTSSSASSTTESLVLTSDQVEETMTTTASTTVDVASRMLGLMAVIVACILSGLAGVWFEKVLKGSKASLWVRNTQLALFSLIIGFVSGGETSLFCHLAKDFGFSYLYSTFLYVTNFSTNSFHI